MKIFTSLIIITIFCWYAATKASNPVAEALIPIRKKISESDAYSKSEAGIRVRIIQISNCAKSTAYDKIIKLHQIYLSDIANSLRAFALMKATILRDTALLEIERDLAFNLKEIHNEAEIRKNLERRRAKKYSETEEGLKRKIDIIDEIESFKTKIRTKGAEKLRVLVTETNSDNYMSFLEPDEVTMPLIDESGTIYYRAARPVRETPLTSKLSLGELDRLAMTLANIDEKKSSLF